MRLAALDTGYMFTSSVLIVLAGGIERLSLKLSDEFRKWTEVPKNVLGHGYMILEKKSTFLGISHHFPTVVDIFRPFSMFFDRFQMFRVGIPYVRYVDLFLHIFGHFSMIPDISQSYPKLKWELCFFFK